MINKAEKNTEKEWNLIAQTALYIKEYKPKSVEIQNVQNTL